MWKRTAKGRELHFYLAGINNQNFLMRDRETGSWWQQVTGRAILGPLKGQALELAAYDELTFGLCKAESPPCRAAKKIRTTIGRKKSRHIPCRSVFLGRD